MLKYADKIIDVFKNGTFLSGHFKNSDDAARYSVFEDAKDFIQKVKLMSEKINLSLFEDFFESPSPANYAKELISIENSDKNKERVAEIKDRISLDLKDRIREMGEKEKSIKMLMRH